MPTPDVAIISPFPRLRGSSVHPSGVSGYTARLADALSEHGVGVHVVAPRVRGERKLDRAGEVVVERRFSLGPGALLKAVRVACQTGAPVVHLQHELFLFGGPTSVPGLIPALASLRRHRVGPVVTMHQVVDPASVDGEFTRLHRVDVPPMAAKFGLSAVQGAVQGLSQAVVVHDPEFGRIVANAAVVQHGIDEADLGPTEAGKAAVGLDPDRLSVLCFGFLSPYKGLESALDAAEEAGPAVELVVAGGEHPRLVGSGYGAGLRARYGSVARFVGYLPDDEVERWFAAADVALLAYPRPFSTSGPYAHALGYGIPILCSPQLGACMGAAPEMVTATDRVSLAARLTRLAADRAELASLAQLTKRLARGRSWSHVAEQHASIYEEVALANRTPGRSVRTRRSGR
ncbi:MAG: glycosyltransferase family protein [Acidimicrobiales bacterium]